MTEDGHIQAPVNANRCLVLHHLALAIETKPVNMQANQVCRLNQSLGHSMFIVPVPQQSDECAHGLPIQGLKGGH